MELRDVLDLVTIAFRMLRAAHYAPEPWLQNIQSIFQEENVGYRLDRAGGVHFYVDEEFARNRAGVIAALGPVRYANALHAFEGGMAELNKVPPNGKGAIRGSLEGRKQFSNLSYPACRALALPS